MILFSIGLLFQVDKRFSKKMSPFFRTAASNCLNRNSNIMAVWKKHQITESSIKSISLWIGY